MGYIEERKLRSLIKTREALAIFEEFCWLGATRWVYIDEGDKIYLSPNMETKDSTSSSVLRTSGIGWGGNVDALLIDLKKFTMQNDLVYVFDATSTKNRKEWKYKPDRLRWVRLS